MGLLYTKKYQKGNYIPYGFKFNEADNQQNLTVAGMGKTNPKTGSSLGFTGVNIQNPSADYLGATGSEVPNINVFEGGYKSPTYKGLQGSLGLSGVQAYGKAWNNDARRFVPFKDPISGFQASPGLLYNRKLGKNTFFGAEAKANLGIGRQKSVTPEFRTNLNTTLKGFGVNLSGGYNPFEKVNANIGVTKSLSRPVKNNSKKKKEFDTALNDKFLFEDSLNNLFKEDQAGIYKYKNSI